MAFTISNLETDQLMTFSESSGQVPGANVPLIFSYETVNIEKFGPEVTIHCPTLSFKKSGKMDFF